MFPCSPQSTCDAEGRCTPLLIWLPVRTARDHGSTPLSLKRCFLMFITPARDVWLALEPRFVDQRDSIEVRHATSQETKLGQFLCKN